MTLIISLISKRVVAHVSDTRHTYKDPKSNKVIRHEDGKVKSIVILGNQGCFLVSYCGRGEIEGIRTDRWLTDKLTDLNAGKEKIEKTIEQLIELLKQKSSLDNDYHKISIAISGYSINREKANVKHFLISNFEKLVGQKLINGNIGEFLLFFPTLKAQGPRLPYAIIINGTEQATENKTFDSRIKKTIKLLKAWDSSRNVLFRNSLIQLVQVAASDKKFGQYISKSCIVTIIPAESWEPESTFFDNSKRIKNIAPHVIGSNISIKDIEF